VIGVPVYDSSTIAVPVEVLDTYVGRYRIASDLRIITREGTRMFSQRNAGERYDRFDCSARVLLAAR